MENGANPQKGYIFDFNGTMFFDGEKHDRAWRQYLEQRIGRKIPREEFIEYAYGRTNRAILEHFFDISLTEEECMEAASEKESIYRSLCVSDRQGLHLAEGLCNLLSVWHERHIPMAIATAANRENLEFYFDVFDLGQWFTWDTVVYDDGTRRGKPAPDYYLAACERLHLEPAECHVFEDSISGMLAAKNAGIGHITAVYGDADEHLLRSRDLADDYILNFLEYPQI